MFDPWSGNIPHTKESLSLCTTTTEAHALQQREALTVRRLSTATREQPLLAATRDKPVQQQERPSKTISK